MSTHFIHFGILRVFVRYWVFAFQHSAILPSAQTLL